MRSALIVLAAAVVFSYTLVSEHSRAGRILDRERGALGVLDRPIPGADTGFEESGYRFERVEGGGLPSVWVASPLEPGHAERWFVRPDGGPVYQYDTVRYHAPSDRPDIDEIRRYLAVDADKRRDIPTGWEPRVAEDQDAA